MADNRRTLNLGLIGCRWITETLHLPALQELSDVKVVAVADSDPDRLKQVADRFHIQHRHTDYMALLEDPVIEAVGVWVPPHCQVKVAQAVLHAGKHLFIEKPSVLDLHAYDELSKQAAQFSRIIMVGFPRRWHRLVRRAREIIEQGTLGRFALMRTVLTGGIREREHRPGWSDSDLARGILYEFGIHHFDLCRLLLQSEVEEVYATSRGDDATAVVTLRMSNHTLVCSTFSQSATGNDNDEVEIYGQAGRLKVSCYRFDGLEYFPQASLPGDIQTRLRQAAHTLRELPHGLLRMRQGGDFMVSYRAEWQHFSDSIRQNAQPKCTMEDGRRALQIVLAARESAALGRPVRVAEAMQRTAAESR